MSDPVVTGSVRFAHDFELPGMLHARVIRCPYPRAGITRVDSSAVPDDVVVLEPRDVEHYAAYGCQLKDQTVLALSEARFAGEPIVAVAAPDASRAEEAAGLVQITFEPMEPVLDAVQAAGPGSDLVNVIPEAPDGAAAYFGVNPVLGSNVCHRYELSDGDIQVGLGLADVVIEQTYRTAGAQQVAMEPHVSVARWSGERLEVWTSSQTPFNVRDDLAGLFGLEPSGVRVICPPMGGSFGAKTFVRNEAIAAALARKAARPVKLALPREEEWLIGSRHPAVIKVLLGARSDGILVAKRVDCWADTGAYADCGPGVAQKMGFTAAGPYRIPNVEVRARCVYTNHPPNGAFRGYGATQVVWASERAMDSLADRLRIDPLQLRLLNVLHHGDRYCTGERMRDVHFADCLERVARAVGWGSGRSGKGLCVLMKGMQTPSRASIAVRAAGADQYVIECATTEMGQGAWRALAIEAARLLDTEPSNIRFATPDTDSVPFDTRTTSSRSTFMMSNALTEAVEDLRTNATGRGLGEFRNEGGLDLDTGRGIASSHWHQGACAAEIEVDEETGVYEVVRLHSAVYAGRVVNRVGAELQNEGAMIMGLGTTLYEAVAFEDGHVTNPNLSDYEIPSTADLPELTHELVERDGAEVHGLGETAVPPVPPAIGNALASRGIDVTDLPITPERVLRAIDRRDAEAGSP